MSDDAVTREELAPLWQLLKDVPKLRAYVDDLRKAERRIDLLETALTELLRATRKEAPAVAARFHADFGEALQALLRMAEACATAGDFQTVDELAEQAEQYSDATAP